MPPDHDASRYRLEPYLVEGQPGTMVEGSKSDLDVESKLIFAALFLVALGLSVRWLAG